MELLAPAGSFACAKAAVSAGADAIYMGGPLFSARAYAESSKDGGNEEIICGDPEKDPLLQSVRYCHLFGKKVYMTVNILMHDREMDTIASYLQPYADAGMDAFIVQDLGLMSYLRKHFPEIPLFVSTQAFVTGPRYAKRLLEMGAVRVVPARELSLSELKAIADTGIEVEAFAHGALCFSYSGQCLMSSFLGGRSGNRGRCAGPCRLNYQVYDEKRRQVGQDEEQYVLSMKDLCVLDRLTELEENGAASLKIEGRMKSPVYVAGVVSIYRKWLDHRDLPEEEYLEDLTKLKELFDRGGFTCGYLDGHHGRDMLTLAEKPKRVPDPCLIEMITGDLLNHEPKLSVTGKALLFAGEAARFILTEKRTGLSVSVEGPSVQRAEKRPVTREDVAEKLSGFGNTLFSPERIEVEMEENVFLPAGALKEMRRNAAEKLEKCILESYRRDCGTV